MKSPLPYLRKATIFLFFILTLGAILRFFVFEFGKVNGRSMEPTMHDEELFIVDKVTLLARTPERGDIVQIYNQEKKLFIVKRVIGLPGETVTIENNVVKITTPEGETTVLKEDYLNPFTHTTMRGPEQTFTSTIEKDNYFVLGDNRENSTDSRQIGPIHRTYIQGIARRL